MTVHKKSSHFSSFSIGFQKIPLRSDEELPGQCGNGKLFSPAELASNQKLQTDGTRLYIHDRNKILSPLRYFWPQASLNDFFTKLCDYISQEFFDRCCIVLNRFKSLLV